MDKFCLFGIGLAFLVFARGGILSAAEWNVTAHGVRADAPAAAKENTRALNALFARAQAHDRIIFPAGKYYVNAVSPEKEMPQIVGKSDLCLRGENAVIVNAEYDPERRPAQRGHPCAEPTLRLRDCRRLTVEGLAFDYARWFCACGEILETSPDRTVMQLAPGQLDGREKPPLTGREYMLAVSVLDADGAVLEDYYFPGAEGQSYAAEIRPGGRLWIKGRFGRPGLRLVIRFTLWNNAWATLVLEDCADITFKSVRSYSSPACTLFVGYGCENLTLDGFTVAPPAGSPQLWGSGGDGVHLAGLKGQITMRRCLFRGLGDDALNVHGRAAKIGEIAGAGLTALGPEPWGLPENWARPGETLEVFTPELQSRGTMTVRAADKFRYEVDQIPVGTRPGDFLQNRAFLPRVEVTDTTVDGGRARAFLLQSENVRVENCTVKNLALPGVIISPDVKVWYEMGPAKNVLLKNNRFAKVCCSPYAAGFGAVCVKAGHDLGGVAAAGVHRDLAFVGNTFENLRVPAFFLSGIKGLKLEGNVYRYAPGALQELQKKSKGEVVKVNCE